VLELLVSVLCGATEARLLAHRFQRDMVAELVLAGLATLRDEIMRRLDDQRRALLDHKCRPEGDRRRLTTAQTIG
jgi:hypothetical protein